MAYVTTYMQASGKDAYDCAFLVHRYPDDTPGTVEDSDRWICVQVPQDGLFTRFQYKNFLTGIWRADDGTVWVSDATVGAILRFDNIMDDACVAKEFKLPGKVLPEGVYGLNNECIFVWGARRASDGSQEFPVFRWDGQDFHELPMPQSRIVAMHALAPDLLYAVGRDGFVARWDGTQWHRYPLPTREVLTSVFVASADEVYACGMGGTLLEGSASGFGKIGQHPTPNLPLYTVAKHQGTLYVGAGDFGCLRRQGTGSELDHFSGKIKATHFEARGEALLITCDNVIIQTLDGKKFGSPGSDQFRGRTDQIPLMDWA